MITHLGGVLAHLFSNWMHLFLRFYTASTLSCRSGIAYRKQSAFLQPCLELLKRHRFAEQVALTKSTSMLLQECALLLRFHALGNDLHPQVAGHADDGLHDGPI